MQPGCRLHVVNEVASHRFRLKLSTIWMSNATTRREPSSNHRGEAPWTEFRRRPTDHLAAIGKRPRQLVRRRAVWANGGFRKRHSQGARTFSRCMNRAVAVRPAEVQTDIPTRTVTEAPASKRLSGATAMPQPGPGQDDPIQPSPAGDVRGQPGTLSGPDPKPSYRTRWNAFVRWCKRNNVQHCPAIPDTVASYLKACAPRNGLQALRTIRAAISSTHCAAGCEDPCTTNLVRTTFDELGRASGAFGARKGARKKVVTRVPLKPAQIEAIRAVAFERRPVGQRMESLQESRRRGRVDVALCSAILETGLQYQYAAALEWRTWEWTKSSV